MSGGLAGEFGRAMWAILAESAAWVLLSLAAGGLVHEFLPGSRLRRLLRGGGLRATAGAVVVGGTLPVCSCGVIPLAVSFYRAGVPLAPVMAFTAATPIINPAAVILSFALLGPQITFAYVVLGLALPFVLGGLAARFGDDARALGGEPSPAGDGCCAGSFAAPPASTLALRCLAGLRWGFFELGPTIGFYLAIGLLLAGTVTVLLPQTLTGWLLGGGSVLGLLGAALLGASIYVCAVAHIPVVAALLAAGAGPGAAIVFLVTGTATNLPELFTLYKTIGRRTIAVYVATLVIASVLAGLVVNWWLLPGYQPTFDPLASLDLIARADRWWVSLPGALNTGAAIAVFALATLGAGLRLHAWLEARRDGVAGPAGEVDQPRS